MNFRNSLKALLLTSLVFLTACNEIDVPNGQIPDEYKDVAAKYMGSYLGKFERRDAQFTVTMNAVNQVLLHFQDARGNDLIDPRCNSVIGDLKQISGDEKNGQKILEFASFEFHSGNCLDIEGDRLNLFFDHKRDGRIEMSAQLLEYVERYEDCYWDVIPGGGSRRRCTLRMINHYLGGKFTKN